ncbi:hypothetical protein PMIN06_007315 [Paraphaeosphaeria minitans]|uniref:Uncharacterized protein n=1 Tax=Paraphaeosphaeria minitans TaxID=565426 RepID=A0A9P6GWJ3_9PLEO|nr:hypothetical protein PMIN01_01038 [Paraphaeosphaeria minitans]
MDIVNLDPAVGRTATTVAPEIPIATLHIMRLHKLLAFRDGTEWPEQRVRSLDDSFKSGKRFADLPEDLKDLVRLLFVKNGPIYFDTIKSHLSQCLECRVRYESSSDNIKEMINEVYFQGNVFHFGSETELHSSLQARTGTRNMQRVGVDLKDLHTAVASLRSFSKDLGLFNQLQELEVGVDEAQMVQAMCHADQSYSGILMRPQDIPFTTNKLVLRMRGIDNIQQISVPKVSFTGWIHKENPESYYSRCTGPIAGGVLETIVARSMMRRSRAATAKRENLKRKASTGIGEHQPGTTLLEQQPAKQPRRSKRIHEKTT